MFLYEIFFAATVVFNTFFSDLVNFQVFQTVEVII